MLIESAADVAKFVLGGAFTAWVLVTAWGISWWRETREYQAQLKRFKRDSAAETVLAHVACLLLEHNPDVREVSVDTDNRWVLDTLPKVLLRLEKAETLQREQREAAERLAAAAAPEQAGVDAGRGGADDVASGDIDGGSKCESQAAECSSEPRLPLRLDVLRGLLLRVESARLMHAGLMRRATQREVLALQAANRELFAYLRPRVDSARLLTLTDQLIPAMHDACVECARANTRAAVDAAGTKLDQSREAIIALVTAAADVVPDAPTPQIARKNQYQCPQCRKPGARLPGIGRKWCCEPCKRVWDPDTEPLDMPELRAELRAAAGQSAAQESQKPDPVPSVPTLINLIGRLKSRAIAYGRSLPRDSRSDAECNARGAALNEADVELCRFLQQPVYLEREPSSLTFAQLRVANLKRCPLFKNAKGVLCHPNGIWSHDHDFWVMALVGEIGEAANFLKKVDRGDFTMDEMRPEIGKELADAMTYLDILAARLHISLEQATVDKFNEVSRRVGCDVFLTTEYATEIVPPENPTAPDTVEQWQVRLRGLLREYQQAAIQFGVSSADSPDEADASHELSRIGAACEALVAQAIANREPPCSSA